MESENSEKADARKPSRLGGLFFALFALPFMGTGVFMAVAVFKDFRLARAAGRWPVVDARLASVELKAHTSTNSKGRSSTTYEATCVYWFEYNGVMHNSTRIGISTGSDNIGDWHDTTHARLRRAYDAGETVPCYVNPDDPAVSLLDRDLRAGLVAFKAAFGLVFGGAGLGFFIMGARRIAGLGKREKIKTTAAASHPDHDPLGAREVDLGSGDWAAGDAQPDPAVVRVEYDMRGRIAYAARTHGAAWLAVAALVTLGAAAGTLAVMLERGSFRASPALSGAAMAFSGLIAVVVLKAFVQHCGWSVVSLREPALRVDRRIGLLRWSREIRMDRVASVRVAQGARFGETRTYSALVVTRDGKKWALARSIPDMSAAFWLALRVREELGLAPAKARDGQSEII